MTKRPNRLTLGPGDIQFRGDDERAEGEAIQPGDLVIEMRGGKPVVYTHPEGSPRGNQARSDGPATTGRKDRTGQAATSG